jgi:hypothetical protein
MDTYIAQAIAAHMRHKGYHLDTQPGHLNIVYLEGVSLDFTLNDNAPDGWNDLSILLDHRPDGTPYILFSAEASTDPGIASTFSTAAKRLGGVARIPFGQQRAWQMGYHRQARLFDTHPALVQRGTVLVHRDANRDHRREGDIVTQAFGINQHSTNPHYRKGPVSTHSAGCLVRKLWADHLRWLEHLKSDPRQVANKKYLWHTTVLAGVEILEPITQA